MSDDCQERKHPELLLVARKGCFGLPTACPVCLPVYCYLRFGNVDFKIAVDPLNTDSDHIPYIEYGDYVAFNNENGGLIESLNKDGIVQLDSELSRDSLPDWLATKAMISSWLSEAVQYELWVASERSIADKIYFSDLPWPIGRVLHWKQTQAFKQLCGISKLNAVEKEEEIYRKASVAYNALSIKLGEKLFFFNDRPTSIDALFLGHAIFVLHVLPDTSTLRINLMKHANLVSFTETFKTELLEASKTFPVDPSSSIPRMKANTYSSSKPKPKEKKARTEQQKTFRRRAKYFLAAQAVAIIVFLSLLGGTDRSELEVDEDELQHDD